MENQFATRKSNYSREMGPKRPPGKTSVAGLLQYRPLPSGLFSTVGHGLLSDKTGPPSDLVINEIDLLRKGPSDQFYRLKGG